MNEYRTISDFGHMGCVWPPDSLGFGHRPISELDNPKSKLGQYIEAVQIDLVWFK